MFAALINFLSKFVSLFLRTSPGAFPKQLSAAEERQLFKAAREGDRQARKKIIEHNLRLVAHIVKKYYVGCDDQEELVSVGTVGLIKAVDSFDCTKGARLATYAAKCIQNEILMYFRAQKKYACEVGLSEAVDVDKDGNPLTYIDILAADDDVFETISDLDLHDALLDAVRNALTEREKQIIVMRTGIGGDKPMPQRAVAQKLGISRSYVSRIEKQAIEKLKEYLKQRSV